MTRNFMLEDVVEKIQMEKVQEDLIVMKERTRGSIWRSGHGPEETLQSLACPHDVSAGSRLSRKGRSSARAISTGCMNSQKVRKTP